MSTLTPRMTEVLRTVRAAGPNGARRSNWNGATLNALRRANRVEFFKPGDGYEWVRAVNDTPAPAPLAATEPAAPQHSDRPAQLDLFGQPAPELAAKPNQGSLFATPAPAAKPAPLAAELHTDTLPLDSTYRTTGLIEDMTDAELTTTYRLERDSTARARYIDIDTANVPGTTRVARRELARLDRRLAIMRRVAGERRLDLRTPAGIAADAARVADDKARTAAAAADLRESERTTADLITAAGTTPAPARQTWHAAGRPAAALYYGRGATPAPRPVLVTVNDRGNRVYDARTGTQIAHYASAVPMWLAPAPAAAAPAPAPVVIVPCGGRKLDHAAPAGDLYVGSYHRQTRKAATAVAERTGARVLILSALHGLVELGTVLEPYDLRMGQPGSVTAARVAGQAAALGIAAAVVTVIAGRAYADVVTAVWPHAVRVLDGTSGMPHQMARMTEVARGEWAAPTAAAAVPALFGAELVAA